MLKPQGLIAGLCVLGILGGYAWWSSKHPAAETPTPTTATPKILSLNAGDIQSIRIAKTGTDAVTVTKDGDKWTLAAPKAGDKPLAADQDAVNSYTSSVSPLNADRLIDEKPAGLTSFGLDNPVTEVDFTMKDGKVQKLLFGSDTVSGSDSYVKVDSDPKVYTVSTSNKTAFEKTAADFRDKRLMTLNSDKITSVSLAGKGPAVEFSKNAGGDWQIVKPKPYRADSSAVEDLVTKMKDAKMDLATAVTAAQFAAATKIGSATLTDDKGAQTLEIRKAKDDYYAKSSIVDGVYKVAADTGKAADKGLDDFRNKKLFDFGFTDPSKVEIGGKLYEKSGDKWFNAKTAIDSSSIQSVIDKLRDLNSTKFLEKASGSPTVTASVTWGDKGKVDKVTISKSGSDYTASRDGDSTGYALDSKAVDDLNQAIAGIKNAPPPDPAKKK